MLADEAANAGSAIGAAPYGDDLLAAGGLEVALARAGELWVQAGPVGVVLAGVSVVASTLIFLKVWQFQRMRLDDAGRSRAALASFRAGRHDEVLALAQTRGDPVVEAVARAVRGRRRDVAEARIREELVRFGNAVGADLRGGLRTLEVIGALAPLLGLLGTVLGLIDAFRALELAGSRVDPAALSGGIWEALLTTAAGIGVAIPVIAVTTWLERRVERFEHRYDDAVAAVFTEDLAAPAAEMRDHGRLDLRATAAP